MPKAAEQMSAYRAQSLTRGLQVLRTIAAAREPITLQDLFDRTGIPKPTLVRLLAILTQEGCTVRIDDRPTYGLGPVVTEIAAGVGEDMDPETLARPRMAELTAQLGHTVNLGVLDDGEVLHVCVELADRPVRYTAHSGTRDALWCTGLGKALLAFSAPAVAQAALAGRKLTRRTPHTITTRTGLDAELKRIRQRGWSHDAEEGAEGLRCFAVPIVSGGQPVGALSVSGPAAELPKSRSAEFVGPLTAAAADLAADPRLVRGLRALGGGPASTSGTGAGG